MRRDQSTSSDGDGRSPVDTLIGEFQPSFRPQKTEAIDAFSKIYFTSDRTFKLEKEDYSRILFGGEGKAGLCDVVGNTSKRSGKLQRSAPEALQFLTDLTNQAANPQDWKEFREALLGIEISDLNDKLNLGAHETEGYRDKAAPLRKMIGDVEQAMVGAKSIRVADRNSQRSSRTAQPTPTALRGGERWRMAVFSEENKATPEQSGDMFSDPKHFLKRVKGLETRARILPAIKTCLVFANMDGDQLEEIAQKLWCLDVSKGDVITKQGQQGNTFFIIDEGKVVSPEGTKYPVTLEPGSCNGELALLHSTTNESDLVAEQDSVLWCINRTQFRQLVQESSDKKRRELHAFLKEKKLLSSLNDTDLKKVVEALEIQVFKANEYIIKQGDEGNAFFIIRHGEARVLVKEGDAEAIEVARYNVGQYFGELSLTQKKPRAASVIAVTEEVEVLCLKQEVFQLLVDPATFSDRTSAYAASLGDARLHAKEQQNASTPVESTSKSPDPKPRLSGGALTRQAKTAYQELKFEDLTVVGTLGRGAFGHVQLVTETVSNPDKLSVHALKTVNKALCLELRQVEHLMSEKEVLQSLDHHFLIQLRATFNQQHDLHFLMEPCLGGELKTALEKADYFDSDVVSHVAACVVLAFENLHSMKIVFRDLKPENILLQPNGYVKLVDFGFAKRIGDNRTYTLCGTPDYLAPEVVAGSGHDLTVDWWALGILIYHLLVGESPFWDENPMGTYQNIMRGQIDYPDELVNDEKDIIQRFLVPVSKRLGVTQGGVQAIKDHPWFSHINWVDLGVEKMKAPEAICCTMVNELDLSHYEDRLGEDDRWTDYVPEPDVPDPFLGF